MLLQHSLLLLLSHKLLLLLSRDYILLFALLHEQLLSLSLGQSRLHCLLLLLLLGWLSHWDCVHKVVHISKRLLRLRLSERLDDLLLLLSVHIDWLLTWEHGSSDRLRWRLGRGDQSVELIDLILELLFLDGFDSASELTHAVGLSGWRLVHGFVELVECLQLLLLQLKLLLLLLLLVWVLDERRTELLFLHDLRLHGRWLHDFRYWSLWLSCWLHCGRSNDWVWLSAWLWLHLRLLLWNLLLDLLWDLLWHLLLNLLWHLWCLLLNNWCLLLLSASER